MKIFNIIKRNILTEKATNLEISKNCYILEVSSDATKIDIKKAVKELYNVSVSDVNILNSREKYKYGRKWIQLKRRTFKKAYVTLDDKKAKLDLSLIK